MPPDRIRLIVADDEALAREIVRDYAARCGDVSIVHECISVTTLAAALEHGGANAAMLDIRMPGGDLFDVLDDIAQRQPLPALVFATAYDRYAVRAFELNAVDYLVKPFTQSRFAETVERLREYQRRGTPPDGVPRLLRDLGRRPDRLLVPEGRRIVPVAVSAIGWIQAEGDYARIHAVDKSYLVYRTLNELEARLDPAEFLRVHRSAIVRLDQILEVEPAGSGRYRVTLKRGGALTVSRGRAQALKQLIL
ncbi:MAG: LytTR family DNA-binding domain-containing protein [Gammaproteobacteria bacterium]|nr:LytTR family DNA-binding domain-containing protein [Gammaproteobacteria bacterium]